MHNIIQVSELHKHRQPAIYGKHLHGCSKPFGLPHVRREPHFFFSLPGQLEGQMGVRKRREKHLAQFKLTSFSLSSQPTVGRQAGRKNFSLTWSGKWQEKSFQGTLVREACYPERSQSFNKDKEEGGWFVSTSNASPGGRMASLDLCCVGKESFCLHSGGRGRGTRQTPQAFLVGIKGQYRYTFFLQEDGTQKPNM